MSLHMHTIGQHAEAMEASEFGTPTVVAKKKKKSKIKSKKVQKDVLFQEGKYLS